METRRHFLERMTILGVAAALPGATPRDELDPRGRIHMPIGVPDTLDPVKTFVEAEGGFSPGFGSYGFSFWLFDPDEQRLFAPTMEGVRCEHGLASPGYLIPWSRWIAGDAEVLTEVCEVAQRTPHGEGFVVAARVRLRNTSNAPRRWSLILSLRPLGPAGWDIQKLDVAADGVALMADGHTAVIAERKPARAGASSRDEVGALAHRGRVPEMQTAASAEGNCSAAMIFETTLSAGGTEVFRFVCPVLPGRRISRHQWVDRKQDAMVDVSAVRPAEGGVLQPDPGLDWYRSLRADALFDEAAAYWKDFTRGADIRTPDARWGECMKAMLGHAGLCMNEGAPDVAVINYNVFNRDGMYVANIMQKAGRFEYSRRALDYFLAHPFNGRAYPEADNPGQVLWSLGQQWRFSHDQNWLARVYPAVRKLAEMIAYYRTTPGPHWVNRTSLEFGNALPAAQREEFIAGRCDGQHPEYTEAFDIAGLRAAAELAEAANKPNDASRWSGLAQTFAEEYDRRYGAALRAKEYSNYCVLWPCRLYPLDHGQAYEQFRSVGGQKPGAWRYFPLATAHQGLLAGNRAAGFETLAAHFAHTQMRGWYVFDECEDGAYSPSNHWAEARTTWPRNAERPGANLGVAMPHGWAIAEVWLLLRDSLVFEDAGRLVLLGGVPPAWFRDPAGIEVRNLATEFGPCSFRYVAKGTGAVLTFERDAKPPEGYLVRFPAGLITAANADGRELRLGPSGDVRLPKDVNHVEFVF